MNYVRNSFISIPIPSFSIGDAWRNLCCSSNKLELAAAPALVTILVVGTGCFFRPVCISQLTLAGSWKESALGIKKSNLFCWAKFVTWRLLRSGNRGQFTQGLLWNGLGLLVAATTIPQYSGHVLIHINRFGVKKLTNVGRGQLNKFVPFCSIRICQKNATTYLHTHLTLLNSLTN